MAEPLSENWGLVLKPYTCQQFVTKMENKSEKHKGEVLFHYANVCTSSRLSIVLSDKYKDRYCVIHLFDGQTACQTSSRIHHGYASFQVKCCAVVSYFHPLITRLHHLNSGFFITISL